MREQGRLERVPEPVHRVDTEDHGDVQARVRHGVGLHGVVLVGPVQTGVAGPAAAGRVEWDVRPAARIDPTLSSTKIFCSQTGLGMLKPPWLVQLLLVSVTCVTSIWTIWPIFSASVIRPSKSLTRDWTDRLELR